MWFLVYICLLQSGVFARETLLSLTSQKTGEWFKEDIRTLGGLDHICDESEYNIIFIYLFNSFKGCTITSFPPVYL